MSQSLGSTADRSFTDDDTTSLENAPRTGDPRDLEGLAERPRTCDRQVTTASPRCRSGARRKGEALAEAIGPRFGVLVRFAAYTGLRAGEICALRAARVDLRQGRVTVAASVTEVSGHGLVFSEPKTYERHSVTLPGFVLEELSHSSITVTLDRYGHLFPKLDETLMSRLDQLGRHALVVPSRPVGDGPVHSDAIASPWGFGGVRPIDHPPLRPLHHL